MLLVVGWPAGIMRGVRECVCVYVCVGGEGQKFSTSHESIFTLYAEPLAGR